MKSGFKVYDTDTHCLPSVEALEPHISAKLRELIPDLHAHTEPAPAVRYRQPGPLRHLYNWPDTVAGSWNVRVKGATLRVLGEAEPRVVARPLHYRGTQLMRPDDDTVPKNRIMDMDDEGADVHMMVPGIGVTVSGAQNPDIEVELLAAQHRWLNELCSSFSDRLKSVIGVTPRNVAASVKEIQRWGSSPWAVGVRASLPIGYPIDHPDLEPVWRAAAEQDLTLVHHSDPFDYPGIGQLWGSPFIGRSASHPWGAMRFVAAVIGSGMLDRYPELRFAILECGFGWIPFWASRLDEQFEYVGYTQELKHAPSEYLRGGRFFASIELHEGAEMAKMFVELFGEGILMMGSDYPHAESRFPDSPQHVLDWRAQGVSETATTSLLWDNPVRCFGNP